MAALNSSIASASGISTVTGASNLSSGIEFGPGDRCIALPVTVTGYGSRDRYRDHHDAIDLADHPTRKLCRRLRGWATDQDGLVIQEVDGGGRFAEPAARIPRRRISVSEHLQHGRPRCSDITFALGRSLIACCRRIYSRRRGGTFAAPPVRTIAGNDNERRQNEGHTCSNDRFHRKPSKNSARVHK